MVKRATVGIAVLVAILGLTGGVASAAKGGEPNGQTERGNGISICTFSGLNDEPDDPVEGGRVQSYGQIVKVVGVEALEAEGETPADLCNPNNAPWGRDVWWRSTPNDPQ